METWWSATSAGIVSSLVAGIVILAIQLLVSPRSERAAGTTNISIDIQSIEHRIYQSGTDSDSSGKGNGVPVIFVIACIIALTAFYAFLPHLAGIFIGCAVATLILVGICVVRALRLGLWPVQASYALMASILSFGGVAYAWWLVFFYTENGLSAMTISQQVKGEGTGFQYFVSLVESMFAAITTPEHLKFASGLWVVVMFSAMMLALTIVTSYRWLAFTSIAYSEPRKFAKLRRRAAAHFIKLTWKDVGLVALSMAVLVFVSPPVFQWFTTLTTEFFRP